MDRDVYISIDIEADGPHPGPTGWGYSMLSLGACIAGTLDADGFVRIAPEDETFYVELRPISDDFVAEALAVCEESLTMPRSELLTRGTDPAEAMGRFADWVKDVAGRRQGKPVVAAWPSSWDFGTYVYWYLMRFTGASPFSHGQHRDIRQTYADRVGLPIRGIGKRSLPPALRTTRKHTHNALDDALGQAEELANILSAPF